MSFMSEEHDLLFFDTFAHEVNEGPNLGLVQFPNPIVIKEIRIIPLGVRVEADFPGGVRLGATNPSSFELEFFINDLTKRDACTFLDIGRFEYKQNVSIKFVPKEVIPTDGLILRGMYSTLTLAVFGCIADISSIIAEDTSITETSQNDILSVNTPDDQTEPATHNITVEIITEVKDEFAKESMVQSLTDHCVDLVMKNKRSPSLQQGSGSRASSLSSDGNRSDRKLKDKNSDSVSRESRRRVTSKDYSHKSKSSPLSPVSRNRSRSKSDSRSGTPSSLKPIAYSQRTPNSPFERSPKRYRKSPRRQRSQSPRSPFFAIKDLSGSPVSPLSSVSHLRIRSRSRSPLVPVNLSEKSQTHQTNSENLDTIKTETNIETDNPKTDINQVLIDDSELFEPLSPDASLSDIGEKISDDENLDQIINEAEDELESNANVSDIKADGFEEISSEEEYDDDGTNDNDILMDYTEYLGDYSDVATFNPFQCEFTPLQVLKDPSLSIYEVPETAAIFDTQIENKVTELVNTYYTHERNEKWVEAVEQLSVEIHKTRVKDGMIFDKLFEFVVDGVNFELALQQPMTAFKVRHIKAGLKLLISLSQTCDKYLNRLLDLNLPHILIELYNKPYMTIPVRLLIIRGIDSICDYPKGVEYLIEHILSGQSSNLTCYQQLLDILVDKPSTRIVVAITCLMKKIHLFECLKALVKVSEESENASEESIALCLSEIVTTYKNANNLLSQPQRYLPSTKQYEIKISSYDSYKAIYKYFSYVKFFECLTNLISTQIICNSDAFDCVVDLLGYLSNMQHGLKYLLSDNLINCTNTMCKVLLQQCSDDAENQIQSIGLKLIYRLQVMQLVDMLFSFNQNHDKFKSSSTQLKENFDDPDLAATLHHLYTMLFSGVGREAVVQVLSAEHNFDAILPFISSTGDKQKDIWLFKSVSAGYAVELCLTVTQLIDFNIISFLDNYGLILLKHSENDLLPKLQILSNWLSPIKNCVFNVDNEVNFKHLMSIVKKHYELARELTENTIFSINPELITTVKLLQYLCLPSEYQIMDADCHLKYKYAIIQIYSMEALSQLLFLLTKLCDTYLKPSHQSVALSGSQGSYVIHFVKPCIYIIKSILTYLVSACGSDFKDMSAVPVLLRIYSLMCFIPSSLTNYTNAQQIQFEITDILLIYTELYLTATESEEAFSKSVWTKMVQQVINYALLSPLTLIHGLNLLSDLLPQPLPLIVKHEMFADEIAKTVNFRKLWSAHLHLLNEEVERLVSSLIVSNSLMIQLWLKRVCAQLCDLSSPTAITVAKCIFDTLNETFDSHNESNNSVNTRQIMCTLNFINDLSVNTPFKLAFTNIIQTQCKKDEKYSKIFTRIHHYLSSNKPLPQTNNTQDLINNIVILLNEMDTSSEGNVSETGKSENTSVETINSSESLNTYFANRQVFVLASQVDDQIDRMVPFCSAGVSDEVDQYDSADLVKIDLIDLAAKYFSSEFDVRANLEKLWNEPLEQIVATKETEEEADKKKCFPLISSGSAPKETLLNKRMQPQRGRGRAFRGNDLFRSRPPNTSRPPSMHVDDYMAMERNDSGSKRVNKDFMRQSRGLNLRSVNTGMRSSLYYSSNDDNSYNNDRRSSPSVARSGTDRYLSRDMTSNRINRSSDSNNFQSQFRWNRLGSNRYDFRYPSYSRSFQR